MEDLRPLLNLAYFYLKFRLRTVKEVRNYLYKKIKTKHWSRNDVEKVIKHLLEQKLLDDQEFIHYLVASRTRTKVKGVFAIKQELLKYGVDKKLIDDYFDKTEINEEALGEKALSSRWSRLKNLPAKKRFEKAARFLISRGFSYELIKKTIKKVENNLNIETD